MELSLQGWDRASRLLPAVCNMRADGAFDNSVRTSRQPWHSCEVDEFGPARSDHSTEIERRYSWLKEMWDCAGLPFARRPREVDPTGVYAMAPQIAQMVSALLGTDTHDYTPMPRAERQQYMIGADSNCNGGQCDSQGVCRSVDFFVDPYGTPSRRIENGVLIGERP
jgi:hypothetical protein